MTFSSFFRQLTSDSFVYSLSTLSSRLISVLLFPLFAREFSPADYGVINFMTTAGILISLACSLGLDSAVYRWYFDSRDKEYHRKLFSIWFFATFAITFLVVVLFFVGGKIYASNHLQVRENINLLMLIVCTNQLVGILQLVANAYLVIERKPVASVTLSLLTSLTSVACSLFFVFQLNWGLIGFYFAQTVAFTLSSAVGYLFHLRKVLSLKYFDRGLFRQMLRYGLGIIPGPVSGQVLLFCTGLIINLLVSQQALGYYQVAVTLASCVALITTPFNQAFQPLSLSIMHSESAKKYYIHILDIYCFSMSFLCLALGLFFKELIHVFLTDKYSSSSLLAGILSFSTFIASLNMIALTGMTIVKKNYLFGRISLLINMLAILLVFVLTRYFDVIGTSFAFLIAHSASIVLLFRYSNRVYPIPYRFLTNLVTIGAAVAGFLLFAFGGHAFYSSLAGRLIILLGFTGVAVLTNVSLFSHLRSFMLYKFKPEVE